MKQLTLLPKGNTVKRKTSLPPLHFVLDLETILDPQFPLGDRDKDGKKRFPPPPCHRIVCIGYAWLEDYRLVDWGVLNEGEEPEEGMLRKLTHSISQSSPTIVGMNSRGFDLPVIGSRCMRYGIPWPWYYDDPKVRYRYSDVGHMDVMDQLSDFGAAPRSSLDVWARLCGLPGKGEISGEDVAEMIAKGRLEGVADYCLSDVMQTAAVFLRSELVRGHISLSEYRGAAVDLLTDLEGDLRTAGIVANTDRARFLLDPAPVAQAAE